MMKVIFPVSLILFGNRCTLSGVPAFRGLLDWDKCSRYELPQCPLDIPFTDFQPLGMCLVSCLQSVVAQLSLRAGHSSRLQLWQIAEDSVL